VWIGWLDRESHEVKPVARAGDRQDYLDKIKVYADDRPEGHGPVGSLHTRGQTLYIQRFSEQREVEALASGCGDVRTSIRGGLPDLLSRGSLRAFAVYDTKTDVFKDKEVALLEEATRDISFALEVLDRKARQQKTEDALKGKREIFRQLTDNIHDVFWMDSPDMDKIIYVSPAYEKVWGRTCKSFHENPKSFLDAIHPDDLENAMALITEGHRNKTSFSAEFRVIRLMDPSDGYLLVVSGERFESACLPFRRTCRRHHRIQGGDGREKSLRRPLKQPIRPSLTFWPE